MTDEPRQRHVTDLLTRWREGSAEDEERLFAAVHDELRRIAAAYMRRERRSHSLQPTALVNEAYLRRRMGRNSSSTRGLQLRGCCMY